MARFSVLPWIFGSAMTLGACAPSERPRAEPAQAKGAGPAVPPSHAGGAPPAARPRPTAPNEPAAAGSSGLPSDDLVPSGSATPDAAAAYSHCPRPVRTFGGPEHRWLVDGPARYTPEERLAKVRKYYRQGSFTGAHDVARNAGYEMFDVKDCHWVYNRDELVRLYALSGYRLACELIDGAERRHQKVEHNWDGAVRVFCTNIQAWPEVVRRASKTYPLSRRARPAFEKAWKECFVEGGWRSKHPPILWDY